MKTILIEIAMVISWCLVLGYPFNLLLYSGDFWGVILLYLIGLLYGISCCKEESRKLNILGFSLIMLAIAFVCAIIFIPDFRDYMLIKIGMGYHLENFQNYHFSFGKIILGIIIAQAISLPIRILFPDSDAEEKSTRQSSSNSDQNK